MEIKAIEIIKEDAQKVISELKEKDNFNSKYKIERKNNKIIIPIVDVTKDFKKYKIVTLKNVKKQREKVKNLKELLKDKVPKDIIKKIPNSYDIAGDIIITSIPSDNEDIKKYFKEIGEAYIKIHPKIKVILTKIGDHKGVFRTQDMDVIYGENKKETILKENNCLIKVDLEKVFYSTRLSSERKRISGLVNKNETVGVFFAGVGPFAIVIAKNRHIKKIIAIELNPIAVKYLKENIKLNNLEDKIIPILGDVKESSKEYLEYFDRIVMPLPKSADVFLNSAIKSIKNNGEIHIYRFTDKNNPFTETVNLINETAEENKVNIEILNKIVLKSYSSKIVEIVVDMKVKKY